MDDHTDLVTTGALARDDDEPRSADPSPALRGDYLSVLPHEVEKGDIILGLRSPVASILTDGRAWYYGDSHGTIIAKRSTWGRVQVVRDSSGSPLLHDDSGEVEAAAASPLPATSLARLPHTITRRNGMFVVMP